MNGVKSPTQNSNFCDLLSPDLGVERGTREVPGLRRRLLQRRLERLEVDGRLRPLHGKVGSSALGYFNPSGPWASNSLNCASLRIGTPSSAALVALEPGESPTTT